MIGARAGPEGMVNMPPLIATLSMPRRRMAVACAVRQAAYALATSVRPAAMAPASGRLAATPAAAATRSAAPRLSALTTPNVVGLRCVLTRSSAFPAP